MVDDEPTIRNILRFSLEVRGHEVLLADDGLRGIAMAQRRHPDAIVLDLMMPVMDGHSVLDALRADERTKGVPTIVLTAITLMSTRDRCVAQGATAVFTKPFDPGQIADALDAALA